MTADPVLLIHQLLDQDETLVYSEPARIRSWNAEQGEYWQAVGAVITNKHLRLFRLKKEMSGRGWGVEHDVAIRLRDINDIDATTTWAERDVLLRISLTYSGGSDELEKIDGKEARGLLAALETGVEKERAAQFGKGTG